MEQAVIFAEAPCPSFAEVGALLSRRRFPVQLRMIDGELAFPDETPPAAWRELRLSTPQGMVTVRREPDRVVLVTWGNADAPLVEAWNAIAWAFAELGQGPVLTPRGSLTADEFQSSAELPSALRG
jgi:hypothetical protein